MDAMTMVLNPDRALARMREQASWGVMWALASALAIAAIVLRAPVAESLALSGLPAGVSPERLESMRQMIAWSTWLGAASAPLALLAQYAFWAALLLLLAACVGAHPSYGPAFFVVAYASLVLALDAAVTGAIIRAGGSSASGLPHTALSLAHAVDLTGSPLARALADEAGLLPLLYWWLVGAGSVKTLKLSRVQAASVVAVLWFVRVSIVAAIATFARATMVRAG